MMAFITICSPTATAKDIATAIRWARLKNEDVARAMVLSVVPFVDEGDRS